ncbi:hypothetical protein KY304_02880 [Candidatus Woesearchaeota archaeon]|nr:hypothetical protein [Candidatus Woesearchaeota archaeon]MBW2979031.1 hypothetical protein [Candidatus Woesearchaeota archaeon]
MKKILICILILFFLAGCAAQESNQIITYKTESKAQQTSQQNVPAQQNVLAEPELKVVSKNIEKRAADIKVKGVVENKGNTDRFSVKITASCRIITEAVTKTGTDLIDVKAGESSIYSILVPIAPYKPVDCKVLIE